MKFRHRKQARQLYNALKDRGQTWHRSESVLEDWAEHFEELDDDYGQRRVQRVLDWYCDHGCGALFVPLIGTAEAFRVKFDQTAATMQRLKGQPLRYFDDLLTYKFSVGRGSAIQREHQKVVEKVQQQIQFVDDLAHNRVKLPRIKATLKKTAKAKPLTKKEVERLKKLVIVDRDLLWEMLMAIPGQEVEFFDYLKKAGWLKTFNRWKRKSA